MRRKKEMEREKGWERRRELEFRLSRKKKSVVPPRVFYDFINEVSV